MSEKTPTVRKNIRDPSNPLELRELNRQLEWVWRKLLGGLDERAFSDGGIRQVTSTVEKIVATEMTADTIDTKFLNAAIAKMMVAVIGVCDVDYLSAVDANVENLIVRRGLGSSFTFDNLKIVYAQIVSATIGELCVKASDGNYYTLDVDSEGKVTATMATVTEGEIAVGHTNAGKVILGTDIVADELSTSDLFATVALVDKIDASRINVDTLVSRTAFAEKLFATEAFVNLLRTEKIVGENSIEMIVGQVEQNAEDIANLDGLDVCTGSIAPEAPLAEGKLWIDTGVSPTVIRRWKGMDVPTDREYSIAGNTLSLNAIDAYFDVSNGEDISGWTISDNASAGVDFAPGNIGVNSSTATVTLKAVRDLSDVVITGAYYTEANCDKITLIVAGTTVLNAVSGSSAGAQRYSGSIAAGQEIVLKYVKDVSQSASGEADTIFTITSGDTVPEGYTASGWDTVNDAEEIEAILGQVELAAESAKAEAGAATEKLERRVRLDLEGLHVGDSQSDSELLLQSGEIHFVIGDSRVSTIAPDYHRFGNMEIRTPSVGGIVIQAVQA